MKRIITKHLSILLTLMMIVSLVPTSVFAADSEVTVTSIEVVETQALYENASGDYFTTKYTDDTCETEQEVEEYYYYYFSPYEINLKVTYSDGTVLYSDYSSTVYDGLDEYTINLYHTQNIIGGDTWTRGGENNTINVEYAGQTCTYNVEILENPVASVEIVHAYPAYENGEGYTECEMYIPDTDEWVESEEYFWYDYYPDKFNLKVTYKDGTVAYSDYAYEMDDAYQYPIYVYDEQGVVGVGPWEKGATDNTIVVEYMGKTTTYNVSVVENPISSIEVYYGTNLLENTGGYYDNTMWDPENGDLVDCDEYFYYDYSAQDISLKITYKDGTVKYSDNKDSLDGHWIYADTYQGYVGGDIWTLGGDSNTLYIEYAGFECKYNVKILDDSELTLMRVVIEEEDIDGWFAVKSVEGHYALADEYTGLVENDLGIWYVREGQVDFSYNDVIKDPDLGWICIRGGKYATDYTGIAKNSLGWWRIVNGKVDFSATGVYQNELGWWYCKDGKVQFNYTGIQKNSNGWWRIVNGKVDFSATGVFQNEFGWWYCKDGKVQFNYTGIKNNANGWWRIENGKVNFSANGVYQNENGWWKVENGKVNFGFTGIAQNSNGKWYCKDGKVDFSKNGRVYYSGKYYTVKGGKVV